MASSICVNHTDRPATSRCSSCHKPICNDCIVRDAGEVFCSNACAVNAARFHARYKGDDGPGFFGRIKNFFVTILVLAVLAAIGLAVAGYYFKIGFAVKLLQSLGLP
jgi:hypothetical protein